jgi:poly-beta-1,6-N-acetyl-D-glucosamine synthase
VKTNYVLITAARNEEKYIRRPLEAAIRQTVLPKRWIIVSDGSEDKTDEIVRSYTEKHKFIEIVSLPAHQNRDVGLKVHAFNAGYSRLAGSDYDFLANVDADVSFGPDYFEFLLGKFNEFSKLVIAGGVVLDLYDNNRWVRQVARLDSVGGPVQFFRKSFFESIGGYVAIPGGGEDVVAEYLARRDGLEVRAFPERKIFHYRRPGTEGRSILRSRFHQGVRDYRIGYDPLFEAAKCVRRLAEQPYVFGSLSWFAGYVSASLKREKRVLPERMIRDIRSVQRKDLRRPFNVLKK